MENISISREQAKTLATLLDLASIREYANKHRLEYEQFLAQIQSTAQQPPKRRKSKRGVR